MKIQCDVCEKEEAIVFCPADEAALCQACDHRVHQANKLATKHHRLNLHCPSSKDCPSCDICQERRALLFCQEDRAILCRECDGTIHQANEYTKKHNRFLLTGAKLSSNNTCTTTYQASLSPSRGSSSFHGPLNPIKSTTTTTTMTMDNYDFESTVNLSEVNGNCYGTNNNQMAPSVSSGNITEYLMETLPGWRVDDFLDASSSSPYGFYS